MDTNKQNYFAELRVQKEKYVDANWRWFRRAEWPPRLCFLISGTLIILGSVSLPYLVNATAPWRDHAITVVSLGVAVLTSLNAFYAWQQTWQKRVRVTTALEHLCASWNIDMLDASCLDFPEANEKACLATSKLFTQVHQMISAENQQLFAQIK